MGQDVDSDARLDDVLFTERLKKQLQQLQERLREPGFGEGPASIGAELEVSLVDGSGGAAMVGPELITACKDRRVTAELDRFNVECNLDPTPLAGSAFATMETSLTQAVGALQQHAQGFGAQVVPIGILPTLTLEDVGPHAMTNLHRFHVLSERLRELRGCAFRIQIDGDDPLSLELDSMQIEGANTSMQVHLRVAPDEYARMYNACQLVTPIALGLATNSPTLFGHRLWKETRVALFKQSVDVRRERELDWQRPPRVSFGDGWLRQGAAELFVESVALYGVVLPVITEQPRPGALEELRLHHGTVWRWNRAIFDPAHDGHLRIEMRALPSGPTPADMSASAAFMVGLTLGMADRVDALLPTMPFRYAEYNFYRAAQHGVDAELLWPSDALHTPQTVPLRRLADDMLPVAEAGLLGAGVDGADVRRVLSTIEARIQRNITPADWQLRTLATLPSSQKPPDRFQQMLLRYLDNVRSGLPVHEWPIG